MTTTTKRVQKLNPFKWNFCVVGPLGALQFWVFAPKFREEQKLEGDGIDWDGLSGGIEIHSPKPLYQGHGDGKPDQERCWLLKAPCWHDGSSLQASEVWIPKLRWCNEDGDYERLWRSLEWEYTRRFEVKE